MVGVRNNMSCENKYPMNCPGFPKAMKPISA
jgi:hypothetical protein